MPRWCLALAGMFLLILPGAAHASIAVAKIEAGGSGTFFVKTDGTVWAMGYNSVGQLGDGRTDPRFTAVQIKECANVATVAAGSQHTLFLTADGTLWATGRNSYGELGDGTTAMSMSPVLFNGGVHVAAVAAGYSHTVFIKSDGTLWAIGNNALGQLGDGSTTNRTTPVQVSGATNVVAVAAGYSHTVFIKSDGTLWATGENSYGQLGDGTTTNRTTPVQVSGATNVVAVAAGNSHTVFIKSDGTLWATGNNSSGQLGDGSTTNRTTPVQVSGGTNVTAVAAGASHTVFIKNADRLWGMGSGDSGQLGASTLIRVTPAVINQAPALADISSQCAVAGLPFNLTINATDLDDDTLTYSATNLPDGATFTPATHTLSWTPSLAQVGTSNLTTFTVTDGLATASVTIAIAATATDVTAPSAPTGLSSNFVASSASASLSWTAATDNVGVTGYYVYRNGTKIGTTDSTSYSDNGLLSGKTYSYAVSAVDSAGNESARSIFSNVTTPFRGTQTRNVNDVSTLAAALTEAIANPSAIFTINLAPGTYLLGSTPLADLSIPGTTIQGPLSGTSAILDGTGLSGGTVLNVTTSNVTISGVTFKKFATHAITIQPHADGGSIVGCSFYGTGASAAILGRGCTGWMVVLNDFYDIAGTSSAAEPAIYFHEDSSNAAIANNLIQDCDRGIGFGSGASEHNGSCSIFNNMISDTRTNSYSGPGISVESVTLSNAYVDNNTVYTLGSYPNAIEYNNNTSPITLRNNLTNKAIKGQNSPSVFTATNNTSAIAAWFNNPSDGDLRLTSMVAGVVDAGTTISGLSVDIEGESRPSGPAFDIGADEYPQYSYNGGSSSSSGSGGSTSGGGGGGGGAPSVWFLGALAIVTSARKFLAKKTHA